MIESASSSSEKMASYFPLRETGSLSAGEMFRKLSKNPYSNQVNFTGKLKNDKEATETLTVDGEKFDQSGSVKENNNLQSQAQVKSTDTSNYLFNSSDDMETEDGLSYDGKPSLVMSSFDSLLAAMGLNSDKISKIQLMGFLQSLVSEDLKSVATYETSDKSEAIAFVKNLIAKFDTLSGGDDYITSLTGMEEPQDYETVTKEQVTSPISLLI